MIHKQKCLFICKKRVDSYGISYGLLNSASFIVNYLTMAGIEAKLVSVVDANGIDKEVSEYKPTHVFIEALWVTPEKFKELLQLHKHVSWTVRIHSKTPFIATEGSAIQWLNGYREIQKKFNNFHVSANSEQFTKELILVLGLGGVYLPNIYFPNCAEANYAVHTPNEINIGCFGAIRPLKNQLIQAFAAIKFGNHISKKVRFHINSNRIEDTTDAVLKNIRNLFKGSKHELVEHIWTSHETFIYLVRQMNIGLQVSYSESFNIVTADFVNNDIPIIVSPDISWMPNKTKADPNSSHDIVEKMQQAIDDCDTRSNKRALNKYNKEAMKLWTEYLERKKSD